MTSSTKKCPFCAEHIQAEARKCKFCHEILDEEMRKQKEAESVVQSQPNPGLAALLSFFIPGLGQAYRGKITEGVVWFVVVVIGYALFVIPGLIVHIICIMNAYAPSYITKSKVEAPTAPKKRRFLAMQKRYEYPALFVLGFFLSIPIMTSISPYAPSDRSDLVFFAFFFAPAILLPLIWFFLRPYALRRGWITDDTKATD